MHDKQKIFITNVLNERAPGVLGPRARVRPPPLPPPERPRGRPRPRPLPRLWHSSSISVSASLLIGIG